MFKIDVCKVCGTNCFWIACIDGELAEKEVCSPECLAQLAVCPTPRALDDEPGRAAVRQDYAREFWKQNYKSGE